LNRWFDESAAPQLAHEAEVLVTLSALVPILSRFAD